MMVAQTALPLTHFAILFCGRSPFYPNVGCGSGAEGANYCYGERGHYELVVCRSVGWFAVVAVTADYTAGHLAR